MLRRPHALLFGLGLAFVLLGGLIMSHFGLSERSIVAVLTPAILMIPLAAGFCILLDQKWDACGKTGRLVALAAAALAVMVGLPARAALTFREWEQRDYAPVMEAAAVHLRRGEDVFISAQAYYAVKPIARVTMITSYLHVITPQEKAAVSAMMLMPGDFPEAARHLGGDWTEVGGTAETPAARRLGSPGKYDLRIFRRTGPALDNRTRHD